MYLKKTIVKYDIKLGRQKLLVNYTFGVTHTDRLFTKGSNS